MSNSKNKDETEMIEINETPVKNTKKTEPKKSIKLGDEALVKCKSTCPSLFFQSRDGGQVTWDEVGKIQELTIRELREIKATQQRFFADQWIIITGVSETEDIDVSPEEIYKVLGISRYFENIVDISKIHDIVKWSESEIAEKVKMMSNGAQENLLGALNKAIKNGTLDSLRKIRAFETVLGCELVSVK